MPSLPIVAVSLLFWACSPRPAADWTSIRAHIARIHPDVEHISTQELRDALRSEAAPPLVLDARTRAEYDVSHILGARLVSSKGRTRDVLDGISLDREIVVYCSVGVRSAQLVRSIESLGYRHVRNLEGSLFQWANAEYPLVGASADGAQLGAQVATHLVHPYDEHWGRLLRKELWSWKPAAGR